MNDAATPGAMPVPDLERRDSMGRLVGVAWHSAGATSALGNPRWLVAVDGSACSLRAVATVAHLAALAPGTAVDVVHIQPWLSKEAAEAELARGGWAATARARGMLDAAGLHWHLHAAMGEAATEIVGLADALGSLGIAVGSHGLTAAESVLLGSVAYRILKMARVPVLIVR